MAFNKKIDTHSVLLLDFGTMNTVAGALDTDTFDLHLIHDATSIQNGLWKSRLFLHRDLTLDFNPTDALYKFDDLKRAFLHQSTFFVKVTLKRRALDRDADAGALYEADIKQYERLQDNAWILANTPIKMMLSYEYNNGIYELVFTHVFKINDILVFFFRNLVKEIWQQQQRWLSGVVYSYPIYFPAELKQQLKEIFIAAGLQPLYALSEPECVAVNHFDEFHLGQRVLIVDSGAGTTDACLLTKTAAGLLIEDARGNNLCGGLDIDRMVLSYWLKTYHDYPENFGDVILAAKMFLNDPKHVNQEFVYEKWKLSYREYEENASKFFNLYDELITPFLQEKPSLVILSGGSNLNLHLQENYKRLNLPFSTKQIYSDVLMGLKRAYFLKLNQRLILQHSLVLGVNYQYGQTTGQVIKADSVLPTQMIQTFYHVNDDFTLYFGWSEKQLQDNAVKADEYATLPILTLPKKLFPDEDVLHLQLELDAEMNLTAKFSTETKTFKPVTLNNFNYDNFKGLFLQKRAEFINSFNLGDTNHWRQNYGDYLRELAELNTEKINAEKSLDNVNEDKLVASTRQTTQEQIRDLYGRFQDWENAYNQLQRDLQKTPDLVDRVAILSGFFDDKVRWLKATLIKYQQLSILLHLNEWRIDD